MKNIISFSALPGFENWEGLKRCVLVGVQFFDIILVFLKDNSAL
jgi:hypothetical protein